MVEALPDDNGERFFSEYMTITMPSLKGISHGEFVECLCALCSKMSTRAVVFTTTIASPKKNDTMTTDITDHEMATTATSPVNNVNLNVTRQQASRPRQPTWSVANALNAANNMAMHAALGGAPYTPIAPLIPMQHQMPFYNNIMQQQFLPCCDKYAQWLTKRLGRPPHHPLCPKR